MLSLRPYQEQAADFIYGRDRSLVLAPVGAGKTAIALTVMKELLDDGIAQRILVLAPKRVCLNVWPVEAHKWAPKLKLAVALGLPNERYEAFYSKAQIVVMNYDNLQWLCDQNAKLLTGFDAIVIDELTRLKNASGERFKALFKHIDQFKIRIGLTGSFTANGLEDVFGQCKIIDQSLLGRAKGAFLQQYFVLINKDYGEWAPRLGSLEAVMQRIKPATFLLEPGEYKDTLPPLNIIEMRCEMPDRAPYEKMKKDFVAEFSDARAVAANAGVVTGKLSQMANGFVYDTRTAPDPKNPGKFITHKKPVWFSTHKFDLLDEVLDGNQRAPTLVWYQYQEDLAELLRRYPHAQTLDNADAVNRWNDGKIELLLAHPQSAGHGINLQGQNRMVFLTLPWSLELYEQAVGRLHRGGQKHEVWCYVLITNKTIDERIWTALRDKRSLSDIALEALK